MAKHNGFNRQKQEVYLLPIIISDSGNPPLSSTSTLTIRVCGCSNDGVVQSCNVEAYVLPIGLSMGALIAILACIILLLGMYFHHKSHGHYFSGSHITVTKDCKPSTSQVAMCFSGKSNFRALLQALRSPREGRRKKKTRS